ncbi:MAG: hypothetical protein WBG09_13125 [Candidatus Sulfotelmatobacter sp.]
MSAFGFQSNRKQQNGSICGSATVAGIPGGHTERHEQCLQTLFFCVRLRTPGNVSYQIRDRVVFPIREQLANGYGLDTG